MEKKPANKIRTRRAKAHPVSAWWTRERVENGLRRFKRDFFPEAENKLPVSIGAYHKLIPADEKARPARLRVYPPADAVMKFFDNFRQAWWKLGYTAIPELPSRSAYQLTEEIEKALTRVYSMPFGTRARKKSGLPGLAEAARSLGLPKRVLVRFAGELGLTRKKELPWSADEIKLLDDHGYKTPAVIARIFTREGFSRTIAAIQVMRKRRQSHKSSPYYSLASIALLFGVDQHKVAAWADRGWLNAGSGETPGAADEAGETRFADKESIYKFIVAQPAEFELRKVDQLWFLHIVTRGAVEFIRSDRLSARSEAQLLEKPVETRRRKIKKL